LHSPLDLIQQKLGEVSDEQERFHQRKTGIKVYGTTM
jgi:hypothetical protein